MEKHSEVLEFQDREPRVAPHAPSKASSFTRWSPEGVERRPNGNDYSTGSTMDRWNGVLSDDVATIRHLVAEQRKRVDKMVQASTFAASPVSVCSTPNLSALIKDDCFQLPKATLMIDSLIDAPMSRADAA